jgi:hypothetical protein
MTIGINNMNNLPAILAKFDELKKLIEASLPANGNQPERGAVFAFLQTALMWAVKGIQYPEK